MEYMYDVGDKVLVDPKGNYMLSGEFVYITRRFEGHNGPCYYVCSENGVQSTYYESRLFAVATNKKENKKMEKLTGYKAVAGVVLLDSNDPKPYNFALYDNVRVPANSEGTLVVVTTKYGMKLGTLKYIVDVNESPEVTAEVVAIVDTSDYEERIHNRAKKEELRKKLDKMIDELDETEKYRKYAEMFPEFKQVFDEFTNL